MANARVEFAKLKVANNANILQELHETVYAVDTTDSPATEPEAPAGYGFALVSAIDANIIVDWGDAPAAAADKGHLIFEGATEAIQVRTGQKLSIIEAT